MKTILLTGTAGFIGFHTATALLTRGDKVIGIDNLNDYYSVQLKQDRLKLLDQNPNFTFHEADVSNRTAVEKIFQANKIDVVCHLAAQAGVRYSIENPIIYIESNVLGTTVIFETAKQHGVNHIVYASSSSVYGKNTASIFKEDDRTDTPISLYAATKKSTELIAHSYNHLFGIESSGLRFFTVYGPWGRPDMFAYLLCKAITEKEVIKVFNQGQMYRDFTYVDDIVSGIVAALDKPLGYQIFNLGGAQTTLLNDFIQIVETKMGKAVKKEFLPLQPGDVLKTSADVSKAQELLGWQPHFTLEQGLGEFVDWFKDYYPSLKKEKIV